MVARIIYPKQKLYLGFVIPQDIFMTFVNQKSIIISPNRGDVTTREVASFCIELSCYLCFVLLFFLTFLKQYPTYIGRSN